jgi:hypothetical protein
MTYEDLREGLLEGNVYFGKSGSDQPVIVGPFFLNDGVIGYRVTCDRASVTEGLASDAARFFLGLVHGEPKLIGTVRAV